jgi:hypothetical protein
MLHLTPVIDYTGGHRGFSHRMADIETFDSLHKDLKSKRTLERNKSIDLGLL